MENERQRIIELFQTGEMANIKLGMALAKSLNINFKDFYADMRSLSQALLVNPPLGTRTTNAQWVEAAMRIVRLAAADGMRSAHHLAGLQQVDLSALSGGVDIAGLAAHARLKEGYCVDNGLKEYPSVWFALECLEALRIEGVQLGDLPDAVGNLTRLRRLWLVCNWQFELPEGLCRCQRLERLEVVFNRLKRLPANFGGLRSLVHLDLSTNSLVELPDGFGGLRSLQTLILNNNSLVGLPPDFGDLSALKTLNLCHNSLKSLPEGFGRLRRLETLELEGNQLEQLPADFGALCNLHTLNLRQNKLTEAPDFTQMPNLQTLNLGSNRLEQLPVSLLVCKGLCFLDLSHNALKTIPIALLKMPNLYRLRLYKCGLSPRQLRLLQTKAAKLAPSLEISVREV